MDTSLALDIAEAAAIKALSRFAAMHPRPPWVTQEQAGIILQRSPPTIRKMIERGDLRTNSFGKITMEEVDRVLATRAKENPDL